LSIRADGSIALKSCRGLEEQAALLRGEGITVSKDGRVDMGRYGVKGRKQEKVAKLQEKC
jgi:alkylated DNA nucleotide flippase Atl1